jgi:hypothetical protein
MTLSTTEDPKSKIFNRVKRKVENVNNFSEQDYVSKIREIESSQDFMDWFGESEMIDDLTGKPLLLLHGTPKKFTNHQENGVGYEQKVDPGFFGEGHYFTLDKEVADQYATDAENPVGFVTYSYCNAEKLLTFDTPLSELSVSKETAEEIDFSLLPDVIKDRAKELFFQEITSWRQKQKEQEYSWTFVSVPENRVLFPFLAKAIKQSALENGYSAGRGVNPYNFTVEYVVYDETTLNTVRRRVLKVVE